MVTETKDRFVNTKAPIENDQEKRQPHERDESPDAQAPRPRGVIAQAAEDLEQGLMDTSSASGSGLEGVTQPKEGATGQANPLPDRRDSMRRHDSAVEGQGKKK
jgi:hypothetical protein